MGIGLQQPHDASRCRLLIGRAKDGCRRWLRTHGRREPTIDPHPGPFDRWGRLCAAAGGAYVPARVSSRSLTRGVLRRGAAGISSRVPDATVDQIAARQPHCRRRDQCRRALVLARAGCLNAGRLPGSRILLLTLGQAIARKKRLICIASPDMAELAQQRRDNRAHPGRDSCAASDAARVTPIS